MNEIERKFLIKSLPDLSQSRCISYERYFLSNDPGFEERIQKKGEDYEIERKFKISDLSRKTEKQPISKEGFELLKKSVSRSIIRDSYDISSSPRITIKIYHGDHEGLVRAEVEFTSEEEAKSFVPPDWMGEEITNTKLGRDSELVKLSQEEFEDILRRNI